MSQKGFALPLVLALVLIIIGAGGLVILGLTNNSIPQTVDALTH